MRSMQKLLNLISSSEFYVGVLNKQAPSCAYYGVGPLGSNFFSNDVHLDP